MENYSALWKKKASFKTISFNEVDSVFKGKNNLIMMEKIDGILGALIYEENKDPIFQTTTGNIIKDPVVLYEYKLLLSQLKVKNIILMGELAAVKNDTILPFNSSASIVKTSYRPENASIIHHYVFDVLSYNDKHLSPSESLKFILSNFDRRKLIRINVPKIVVGGIKEFHKLYQETQRFPFGIEGVVIKTLDSKFYKVKSTNSFDLALLGAGNIKMKLWNRNQISYLVVAFMDRNGLFRLSSKVGTGFTIKQREEFFEYINKNKIQISENVVFVKPELVVQISFQEHNLLDMPIIKYEKGLYHPVGKNLSASMRFPSFDLIREDKKVNIDDLRMEQIPMWKY